MFCKCSLARADNFWTLGINGAHLISVDARQHLQISPNKWAAPNRFKVADFKPKRHGSRYFSGLVLLCLLIGFVVVQAWPRLKPELAKPVASFTVRVIDGDTISLEDGKPDVRLVGLNAPETGNRARCDAERQKGEVAKQRLRELVSMGG
jgi:hypothetical protein